MKVEEKQNPSIFLATFWKLSSDSGNLEKYLFKNLANLGQFSRENSFVYVEIIFFRSKFGENLPVKETRNIARLKST
jgi:hypothetical protein